MVVLAYAFANLVATFAAYPAGVIADKFSPQLVYMFGLITFAIAYCTLGLTQNHHLAFLMLGLYGFFGALTDGVGKSWIARLSQPEHRGSAQGVYQASMNFAILGAGIWGGALWSRGAQELPLVLAGIGAALGAALALGASVLTSAEGAAASAAAVSRRALRIKLAAVSVGFAPTDFQ